MSKDLFSTVLWCLFALGLFLLVCAVLAATDITPAGKIALVGTIFVVGAGVAAMFKYA